LACSGQEKSGILAANQQPSHCTTVADVTVCEFWPLVLNANRSSQLALARRCSIVVIASAYITEDPGFESRPGVTFVGIYTLQCCCYNLIYTVNLRNWEKCMHKKHFFNRSSHLPKNGRPGFMSHIINSDKKVNVFSWSLNAIPTYVLSIILT
jgi:hypothetical protein